MNNDSMKLISLILIVSVTAVSCMTNQAIRQPQTAPNVLKPGDGIQVVTKEGKTYRFKVKEITSDSIIGDKLVVENMRKQYITIKIDQIDGLWKRKFSLFKTVRYTVLAAGIALITLALLIRASGPPTWGWL